MDTSIKFILVFFLGLTLMSCTTLKTNKGEEEVEPQEQEEVETTEQVEGTSEEVPPEETVSTETESSDTATDVDAEVKEQADLNADVQGLKQEVAFIKGEFENRDEKLKLLEEKTLESLASLESRIEELEKNLSESKPQEKASLKTTPTSLYEKGKKEIEDKKYRQAILSFQLLLERYPASTLADDAHYWIGETYFLLDDCQRAILEYDIVRKKYPQGTAIVSSLYNEAQCFEKLGSKKEALLLLEDLVSRFPDHPKAKMAAKKLKPVKK